MQTYLCPNQPCKFIFACTVSLNWHLEAAHGIPIKGGK